MNILEETYKIAADSEPQAQQIIDEYKAWLSTADGSFMALVITDVWKTAPYMALLILAGLQMVPEDLYEAAKIDGANVFQRFLLSKV